MGRIGRFPKRLTIVVGATLDLDVFSIVSTPTTLCRG